jgi:hypothetical protein
MGQHALPVEISKQGCQVLRMPVGPFYGIPPLTRQGAGGKNSDKSQFGAGLGGMEQERPRRAPRINSYAVGPGLTCVS